MYVNVGACDKLSKLTSSRAVNWYNKYLSNTADGRGSGRSLRKLQKCLDKVLKSFGKLQRYCRAQPVLTGKLRTVTKRLNDI